MHGLLTDAPQVSAFEMTLAKQMAETLHKHYPEHLWGVSVNAQAGMADIRNMALSGEFGYRMKIGTHFTASDWDLRVKRAGGEILERYRVARGRADNEQLAYLPTDFSGRHKADI